VVRRLLLLILPISFSANAETTGQVTLYSPRGPAIAGATAGLPGRKAWYGHLWLNHKKIGLIRYGQFVTLQLPVGDHELSGQSAFGHESTINTVISLRGEHSFVRLIVESKAVAGFGPMHYVAEPVSCEEAYREAATLQPVKLKSIDSSFPLEHVVRESYFPDCGKSTSQQSR
jgi:hypothetical protein